MRGTGASMEIGGIGGTRDGGSRGHGRPQKLRSILNLPLKAPQNATDVITSVSVQSTVTVQSGTTSDPGRLDAPVRRH
jgi:hypothetical protein